MDYEKEYKSLVAKVKNAHQFAQTDSTKSVLEDILPELRESEDERLRKRAIAILKQQRDYWSYDGPMDKCPPRTQRQDLVDAVNAALSYLEKQKEQKPAYEQFPPLEGLDAIKAKYYDDGFKNGFDEGVESVKPAEWSEEDEKFFELLHTALYQIKVRIGKDEYDRAVDWLKSLRTRPSWKPSDEQMSSLKQARDYYMSGGIKYVGRHLSEIAEQLEKL